MSKIQSVVPVRNVQVNEFGNLYKSDVTGEPVYRVGIMPPHYVGKEFELKDEAGIQKIPYADFSPEDAWAVVEVPASAIVWDPRRFPSVDGAPVDRRELAGKVGAVGVLTLDSDDTLLVVDSAHVIEGPNGEGINSRISAKDFCTQLTACAENMFIEKQNPGNAFDKNAAYVECRRGFNAVEQPYERTVRVLRRGKSPALDMQDAMVTYPNERKNLTDFSNMPARVGTVDMCYSLVPKSICTFDQKAFDETGVRQYTVTLPAEQWGILSDNFIGYRSDASVGFDGIDESCMIEASAAGFSKSDKSPWFNPEDYYVCALPSDREMFGSVGVSAKAFSAHVTAYNAFQRNPELLLHNDGRNDICPRDDLMRNVIRSATGGAVWNRFEIDTGVSAVNLVALSEGGYTLSVAAAVSPAFGSTAVERLFESSDGYESLEDFYKTLSNAAARFNLSGEGGASALKLDAYDSLGDFSFAEEATWRVPVGEATEGHREDVRLDRHYEGVDSVVRSFVNRGRDMSDIDRAAEGITGGDGSGKSLEADDGFSV